MTSARSDHSTYPEQGRSAPEVRAPERMPSESSDAPNVISFRRPACAAGEAPAIAVAAADRPAPAAAHSDSRARTIAILVGSVLVHAALYAAVNREPAPMASIGLEVISVEFVVGDNREAGTPAPPADSDAPPVAPPQQAELTPREEAPLEPPLAAATPQEATAAPSVAPSDAPLLQTPETTAAVAPPVLSAEIAQVALRDETAPEKLEPDATPPEPPATRSIEVQPRKTADVTPRPQHRERRIAQPEPGAAITGSNGISPGRSSANSNYHGLVAAHLARYKRFPADARSRGEEGRPVVTFGLDGGGRVTRVALVRASGVASIDQEAQAMVHRASPFPPPPDGKAASFTVPVSFRFQ